MRKLFCLGIKLGDQGEDVRKLQECLKKDPTVYPEGKVTGYFGSKTKAAVVRFQEKYKKEILSPLGLKKGTGKVGGNTREKLNKICFPSSKETTPLSLTIVTCNKWPLKEIANIVKSQLEKVGFKITIEEKAISSLENDVIKPRNYEVLLFGEVLGAIPDPFSFWHSTQKENPGLNITGYQNTQADKLRGVVSLEDGKQILLSFSLVFPPTFPVPFFKPKGESISFLYFS